MGYSKTAIKELQELNSKKKELRKELNDLEFVMCLYLDQLTEEEKNDSYKMVPYWDLCEIEMSLEEELSEVLFEIHHWEGTWSNLECCR